MVPDAKAASTRHGLLAAFHYPNYRYLWGSGLVVFVVYSIYTLVIGWLVLELTNSPSLVGLVAACRFLGTGLGPFFGTLADRFDRRRILIVTRVIASAFALTFVALYYTSLLEVWHIFVLALFGGIVGAFGYTTFSTMLPDTVESRNLSSAVGMQMLGFSTALMIGPAVGGYLYEHIEAGGCFAVIAAAYLFSCLLILPLRLVDKEKPAHQESVWKSLIGGIHYIVKDRSISALIVMVAIANLFVWPCVVSIMPVFARDVLHLEASGLGWLSAAAGLGGLIGAVVASSLGRFKRKGRLIIIALIAWSVFLVFFSSSRSFPISLALLVGVGIFQMSTFTIIQLLLLSWTAGVVRGRVIGVRQLAVVMSPMGSIFLGFGADLWGVATAIMISASACILVTILTALWAPELRRRQ
jgi:MFS family permease